MTESQEVTHVGRDPILAILARLANDVPSAEIHVTLAVGGGVVSGALVSRLAWLKLSAETMEAAAPGAGTIPAELARMLEEAASKEGGESEPATYDYLHLKDARYVDAAGAMPSVNSSAMLWRGRIAHVAGWSWGSFPPS
jgi:hypothetical protein